MYKCELEFLHSKDRNSSVWCVDAFIQLVNTFFIPPVKHQEVMRRKNTATFTERLGMRVLPEYDWLVYGCPPLSGVRMPLTFSCSKLKVQLTDRDNPHNTAYNHKKTFLFFKGGISLGCTHRERRRTVDTLGRIWNMEHWIRPYTWIIPEDSSLDKVWNHHWLAAILQTGVFEQTCPSRSELFKQDISGDLLTAGVVRHTLAIKTNQVCSQFSAFNHFHSNLMNYCFFLNELKL